MKQIQKQVEQRQKTQTKTNCQLTENQGLKPKKKAAQKKMKTETQGSNIRLVNVQQKVQEEA